MLLNIQQPLMEQALVLHQNPKINQVLSKFIPNVETLRQSEETFEEFLLSVDYTLKLYAVTQKTIDLITFGESNRDLKAVIDSISITTKEAKEKFVQIFTSIVSFVKNIQGQKAIMKVAMKTGKNLPTKFVEKSKVQSLIQFMGELQTFRFMKTKEFADLAIQQLNDWSSGKEGLSEDFKYLQQIKDDIEKVENEIQPLLREIFDKNYQLKAFEGQINGIRGQLASKEFQSEQIKDKMKGIDSMLQNVMEKKSRTPQQLEDCYVHTKRSYNWFWGYSYSRTYSYETRSNVEYTRLNNLQNEMQSLSSSASCDLDRVDKIAADFKASLGDLQGRCTKLNGEIDNLSKQVDKKREDIRKLQEKLAQQENQLKERMEKSSVALNYKGNSVFYIIKSLECVGKLNKAMTGGELLFAKFAGLMIADLQIMSDQLELVDVAETSEEKSIFWKEFFESKKLFIFSFVINIK